MKMSELEIEIKNLGEHRKVKELKELIEKTPGTELTGLVSKLVGRPNAFIMWSHLLLGFGDDEISNDKRYSCITTLLRELNIVEVSYKQTYDLITRLFLDLPKLTTDQLIEIVDVSTEHLKKGDPKYVGWKDLIPEALSILSEKTTLYINSIPSDGAQYRLRTVRNLCTLKWPPAVLTPIANMFRDMKLTSEETLVILTKFCYSLQHLNPLELPALAFQLFSMGNTASQIVITIIALQRYFHKHYYKKLYADMSSDTTDFDSIDAHSDKELRETEETILHHLSYCTQMKISEIQLSNILKNLAATPDLILTPFILSSILTMTKCNRDPSSSLSSSVILPYLRNVIKNNEDEKELFRSSAWCRDAMQSTEIDLDRIFTILIDQNKEGKDVVTPGLVNLAFTLLKAKNSPKLNMIGISFIQKFIKKRYIFGKGIIKKLTEWAVLEQDANQYTECLTALSLTDTFTVSECVDEIKHVLDYFLDIPGEHAMQMMCFILVIIKISNSVRDEFIQVLTKSMYARQSRSCKMGVFGFCMLLKQLNNSNSNRGSGAASFCTQQTISGFSVMSQATLGNRNNPQRHFDMLTLEIIGLLRNCFNESLEIKETLYEGLTRAVQLNPKLTPHIIHFINPHFRSFFEFEDSKSRTNFDKIVLVKGETKEIEVKDNLGRLISFVAFCILTCEKQEINHDTSLIKEILTAVIDEVLKLQIKELEINEPINHKMHEIFKQFLSVIEALMAYSLWTSKPTNENVLDILRLFKHHEKTSLQFKEMLSNQNKKTNKKGSRPNETDLLTQNVTLNGTIVKRVVFNPENIWNLPTIERFLRILHDDVVPFASEENLSNLKSNHEFARYVTHVASKYVENLRSQPNYKQISHSRRMLQYLTEVSRLIYERCIKRLPELWKDFDMTTAYLSAECFRQCLLTANGVFKKKFLDFLKGIDFQFTTLDNGNKITNVIQNVIEKHLQMEADEFEGELDGPKIPVPLMQCLEVLYEQIPFEDTLTTDAYKWLMRICDNYKLDSKDLGFIHKLLLTQRMKTHSGEFFNTIAINLEKILGQINEEYELDPQFELKSITDANAESCFLYLLAITRKQIEDIEYFITKARSLYYKTKLTSESDREICEQHLKSMERSICSQLIHISNTLLHLTNTCVPLGPCIDNLIKILMQIFICMTNLTKHLIMRQSTITVSFQSTKFEQLLRTCGKSLPTHIYNLIQHIEASIFNDNRKKKIDAKADKARVLKETKFISKLIMRVENFNKFVIMLSNKTDSHLAHLLHMGTVRDFRIKTAELRDAINQTLTRSSEIEMDESMVEEVERQSDEDETVNDSSQSKSSSDLSQGDEQQTIPTSGENLIRNETNTESTDQILKNLAQVNRKTKQRKTKHKDDEPPKLKRAKKK